MALGNPDSSLSHAEHEVRVIAQLFDTSPMTRTQATESLLYSKAGQFDMLHLAAHGIYDPINPLFTRIELAADNKHDGQLEMFEVYNLNLSGVNLVTLSACNTALGEQSKGDEVVGLTRAFLYAGTPNVITSLWKIDDESTAYLMEHLYTYIGDGSSTTEALRRAQLDTLAKYPEPHHWAAFTLHGDGADNNQ